MFGWGFTPQAMAQGTTWQPPSGIPFPSFGILETARAVPSPWLVPTAGFYYVDASALTSTDLSNPYGTPAKPRKTIPSPLPAGAVVELHGIHAVDQSSTRAIRSAGTASAPVFIRGASALQRPRATGCWEVWGSYFVIENIEFVGCSMVVLFGDTHHAALRHSEIYGNPNKGGLKIVGWNGGLVNDVLIWNNKIHDNGDVNASYDQDVHGILIGEDVSRAWVVDNQLYRNSGDGIQISAGSAAKQASTHHIFVGRNDAHDNKQGGFWTKQAVDVIFSQNRSYRHRPSNSSVGACMGGQYAPELVWYINNAIWDCDHGIQLASDNGLGVGRYQFFIGNIITRIHDSDGGFQTGSAWQNCAISLPGGTVRYVLENSIYDVDSAVCSPSTARLYLVDNLIESVRADGHHLMFDQQSSADGLIAGGNIFAPNLRVGINGQNHVYSTPQLPVKGQNNVVSSAGWVAPLLGDFRLSPTSPARDHGVMDRMGVWEFYQSRYGVPLSRDFMGISRTAAPDAGAVEYQ